MPSSLALSANDSITRRAVGPSVSFLKTLTISSMLIEVDRSGGFLGGRGDFLCQEPGLDRSGAVEHFATDLDVWRARAKRALALDSAERHPALQGVFIFGEKVFECHRVTFGCGQVSLDLLEWRS